LKAWIYNWDQILFGRRRKLWVPIPGIATHMDANALSPTIDWKTRMQAERSGNASHESVRSQTY